MDLEDKKTSVLVKERARVPLNLKVEQCTKVSGLRDNETAKESKNGFVDQDTKANGRQAKRMVKESCIMRMAIFMKEICMMTRLTEAAHILTLTVESTLAHFVTTNSMALDWRHGPMAQSMKVLTTMKRRTERVR